MNISAVLIKNFKISTDSFFTWSSGIKAPFYTDNRLLLSNPSDRSLIINEFVKRIKIVNPNIIAGIVTSGLPYAAIIADRLELPLIYVRDRAKDHGTKKMVEGSYRKGDRVVVIEDLISTGESTLMAVSCLKEFGVSISKVMSIFSYNLPISILNFKNAGVVCNALCNLDDLMEYAQDQKMINAGDLEIIENWRQNYAL
jgi:orotate phosphoribosyltransferase